MAGEPLLRGVSFKVERRDRLTLSGRNGSGQDHPAAHARRRDLGGLRRARPGEGHAHRAARPAPAARARSVSARLRARAAAATCWRSSASWRSSSRRWRAAPRTAARSTVTPALRPARARRRLHLARAGDGHRARAGLPRGRPRPPAQHLLGRRADARLARAHARWRSRPAAAGRAHQPPRHRVARMAGATADVGGRGGDPRRPRPLVPRVGRHRGARARGWAARATSPARGTPGARSRPLASWRSGAPSSASRRRSSGSSAS